MRPLATMEESMHYDPWHLAFKNLMELNYDMGLNGKNLKFGVSRKSLIV